MTNLNLKVTKQERISDYQVHATDTGSTHVQCALLTDRIQNIAQHSRDYRKDHSAQRGLQKLVGQRKRLLAYLKKNNLPEYQALIARLGLRK